jgi:hypothetical protein
LAGSRDIPSARLIAAASLLALLCFTLSAKRFIAGVGGNVPWPLLIATPSKAPGGAHRLANGSELGGFVAAFCGASAVKSFGP